MGYRLWVIEKKSGVLTGSTLPHTQYVSLAKYNYAMRLYSLTMLRLIAPNMVVLTGTSVASF